MSIENTNNQNDEEFEELIEHDVIHGSRKRKLSLKPIATKYKAIVEVDKGIKSKTLISKEVGVAASTLSSWIKDADKIKLAFTQSSYSHSRKKIRRAKFADVDAAVVKWYKMVRATNKMISGKCLMEKAEEFAKQLGRHSFICTPGWLDRFKHRYEIVISKSQKPEKAASSWNAMIDTVMPSYDANDIYNIDETGLLFGLLPEKAITFRKFECCKGELATSRLTILLACNLSGTDKLPPVIIGKQPSPDCFKSIKAPPGEYLSNKHAWITSEMFTDWVQKLDVRFIKQGRKIVLILDNCAAHPRVAGLQNIKLMFTPANTSGQTMPLYGIIKNMKVHYRKHILAKQLAVTGSGASMYVTILDAIRFIKLAWQSVTVKTVRHCFKHTGFTVASDASDESNDNDDNNIPSIVTQHGSLTLMKYASIDDNLVICQPTSDKDIIDQVIAARQPDKAPTVKEQLTAPPPVATVADYIDSAADIPSRQPTIAEAMSALETLTAYIESRDTVQCARGLDEIRNFLSNCAFTPILAQFSLAADINKTVVDHKSEQFVITQNYDIDEEQTHKEIKVEV